MSRSKIRIAKPCRSFPWLWSWIFFCLPWNTGCGYFNSGKADGENAATEDPNASATSDPVTAGAGVPTDPNLAAANPASPPPTTAISPIPSAANNQPTGVQRPESTNPLGGRLLMVGSFNIQRFGIKKFENEKVLNQLMEVTYPFDVLAIQEVVSQQEAVVENFVEKLNAKYNTKFNYVVGPFVGRTTYKERAAFIYDTSRVKLIEQPFLVADPEDKLHREPLVARFQVRDELSPTPFTFVLANVHLDPDSAAAELDHVSDLLNAFGSMFQGKEDDFLVVGDFNLSPDKMFKETKFSARPDWKPVLGDQVMTNTRKTQAYDNILYHTLNTQEFMQRQGVIDLQSRFQISQAEAEEISDHLPIWAAFSLLEAATQEVANNPTDAVR
ncbi:MAG: hypothetical protein JNL67_21315 [Planctomycetaceae bacterium]|nr:hypothetical protein [Planctomycetaceae bacterium]